MKKTSMVAILSAVLLCGCSSLNPTVETVAPSTEQETTVAIVIPETSAIIDKIEKDTTTQEDNETTAVVIDITPESTTVAPSNSGRMEAMTLNYKVGSVSINYPALTGMSDADTQTWANSEIYNDMMKILDIYNVNVLEDTLTVDYSTSVIYKSEFAFVYTGTYINSKTNEKVYIKLTEDYNLLQKKHIRLSTRLSAAKLTQCIKDGEYDILYAPAGTDNLKKYLNSQNDSFFTALVSNADFGGEMLPSGFSYNFDGQVAIIINLPHALGDYAEIAIKQKTK